MQKSLKGFSVLNTVFNIRAGEWPRVLVGWAVRLFYRTAFVVAWTVVVGIFVSRYGIYYLPYLFVVNALFTILGSVFYSTFFNKFRLEVIMIGTVLASCLFFLIAHFFGPDRIVLFFTILLVAISVFLMQLRVILESYVEGLFSPLESERAFPFVESAETFGGITAGLLITFLIGDIATSSFIFLLVGLLLLILPLVLLYRVFSSHRHLSHCKRQKHLGAFEAWSKFSGGHFPASLRTYIKGILVIVFLHYMLFNLLEFQYTKAVYMNASHIILEAGSGFEHAIVHDLGRLFILFSSLALLVQLFIGSRLINSLGIVGSMMVHPIVTIFSLFGLFFSFSFPTAVLAKNNFTLSSVIYLNAYHSSYYAIPESLRNHARELLVGVVRPVGAILGAVFLILIQKLFMNSSALVFSINVIMLLSSVVFLYVTYLQRDKYTNVALSLLKGSKLKADRFHSIEILAQRGHRSGMSVLTKLALNKREKVSVRVKAVSALAGTGDVSLIPSFILFLNCGNEDVRRAALLGLSSFPKLGRSLSSVPILERDLLSSLKLLFKEVRSFDQRRMILEVLSKLSTLSSVDFLLNVLKSPSPNLKATAILALADLGDSAVCEHLRPFLKSRNWRVRSSALIALKKSGDDSINFESHLKSILSASSFDAQVASMNVVGTLKLHKHKSLCLRLAHSNNSDVRLAAIVALVRLGNSEVLPLVLDIVFSKNFAISSRLKRSIESIDTSYSRYILGYVHHSAVQKLHVLLDSHGALKSKKRLSKDLLCTLRNLYFLSDDYDEVDDIGELLLEFH